MKDEIKHFKSLLRQGSLRHMNILLDDKFQKELQTIIEDYEKLQQENDKLREQQKEFINYLEDEIHSCEAVSDLLFNSNKEMKVYKEILQKYRKIIGDDK